jgi:hypothetical protein
MRKQERREESRLKNAIKAEDQEGAARSTFPGPSFASRKANKDIVLFGLILDEQRRTNELLYAICEVLEQGAARTGAT